MRYTVSVHMQFCNAQAAEAADIALQLGRSTNKSLRGFKFINLWEVWRDDSIAGVVASATWLGRNIGWLLVFRVVCSC